MTTASDSAGPRRSGTRLPATAQERAAWQRCLNELPVLTDLGAELDLSDDCEVRIRLVRSRRAHFGGLGSGAVNGATLSALVDCGIAATGILLFRGRTCGTLHLSLAFIKPVRSPSPQAACHVVRRTDALAFIEARICDAAGAMLVRADGIVAVARAAGGDENSWASLTHLEQA